jgi:DNA repair exonuclease SbcCD ATPase subunit
MIKNKLNSSVLAAKAEMAAGLDGVSHQLLQSQQERLTIAERSLKQQIKPLQAQLLDLRDDSTLFKRMQPLMQKQMMVIADKISRKKVDNLAQDNAKKLKHLEELQAQQLILTTQQTKQAMTMGIIGGALLGSAIAIGASFIF